MSNPKFRSGPISFKVKSDVKKGRLVQLDEQGISLAGVSTSVFGAVSENGTAAKPAEENSLHVGYPNIVAVHSSPATVSLDVDGDGKKIKQGSPVYAGKEGKAAASGSVLVGVAVSNGKDTTVETRLITPVRAVKATPDPKS